MDIDKRVHSYSGFGGISGFFEMEIYINIPRELTVNDVSIIGEYADKIRNAINSETHSLNPDVVKEVKVEKSQLISLFGDKKIYVSAIPNGYEPENGYYKLFPWYIVTTEKGHIKIGWRKRVILIDWTDSDIAGEIMFPDEDVTKGEKYIHAWGYEKAQEYIDKLLK